MSSRATPTGRPAKQAEKVVEEYSDGDEDMASGGSSPSVLETGDVGEILSSNGEDEDEDDEAASEEESERDAQSQLRNISFGTLAKAQDSMPSNKRKRGSDSTGQQEDKLEALRARLRELKEAQKGTKSISKTDKKSEKAKQKSGTSDTVSKKIKVVTAESATDSGEDSEDEEEEGHGRARSSKHAPMSQSSKFQVTRRRDVVGVTKRKVRDPRFGPMAGQVDDTKLDHNYSFLQDYQSTEMDELKAAIKKSKTTEEKETLKRALMSMENRKRAKEDKDRKQAVLREHRKKEKEAIKEGKQPFYLKRSEVNEQALVDKFGNMKAKERDRAIERRRKKDSQKEKKSMPSARRVAG